MGDKEDKVNIKIEKERIVEVIIPSDDEGVTIQRDISREITKMQAPDKWPDPPPPEESEAQNNEE